MTAKQRVLITLFSLGLISSCISPFVDTWLFIWLGLGLGICGWILLFLWRDA